MAFTGKSNKVKVVFEQSAVSMSRRLGFEGFTPSQAKAAIQSINPTIADGTILGEVSQGRRLRDGNPSKHLGTTMATLTKKQLTELRKAAGIKPASPAKGWKLTDAA